MAVDKLSGAPTLVQVIRGRGSLEDALARFDEQCSHHAPSVIRKRLKQRLVDIQVDINGRGDSDV